MNAYASVLLWATYLVSLYFALFFFFVFLDKRFFQSNKQRKVKLTHTPFVSVLIPACNEEATIVATIKSVLNLDYPKDKLEVIVIDDGSTDRTRERVVRYVADKPLVTLISHPNRGKAASLNHALARAHGEFFACLDADSFVGRDALRNMLRLYYHENSPDLAVVTPALKVKSPRNLLQKVQWIEYLVMVLVSRLASNLDCLYVAPGPFSLYRTDIIRNLGGFDEHNLTEDQEIAYRVQAHHYTLKQCPTAVVHTIAPATFATFSRQRRRWYKGSLSCLHKYRGIILNRTYGDFGIVQMLKNSFGFLIALSGISFAFYYIVWPIVEKVRHLSIVGFDIWPYLRNITFTFNVLTLDAQKLFILSILFSISAIFFYAAHRNADERINKFGLLPVIPYFFVYYLVKGSVLVFSLVEYAVGKKQKW